MVLCPQYTVNLVKSCTPTLIGQTGFSFSGGKLVLYLIKVTIKRFFTNYYIGLDEFCRHAGTQCGSNKSK